MVTFFLKWSFSVPLGLSASTSNTEDTLSSFVFFSFPSSQSPLGSSTSDSGNSPLKEETRITVPFGNVPSGTLTEPRKLPFLPETGIVIPWSLPSITTVTGTTLVSS